MNTAPTHDSAALIAENAALRADIVALEAQASQVLIAALDVTARRQLEEKLRTYSRRLIDVQEAERAHLARELHDEIGQMLTGLNLTLEVIDRGRGFDMAAVIGAGRSSGLIGMRERVQLLGGILTITSCARACPPCWRPCCRARSSARRPMAARRSGWSAASSRMCWWSTSPI